MEESRYWGSQTERALKFFAIGEERFPRLFMRALGLIKKAAVLANMDLGLLLPRLGKAMIQAADEVISGDLDEHFPLAIWQSGSGTQTNMNMNEVIANRANEILGSPRGLKSPVHPNDHVNKCQSTNDVFPAAMHLACGLYMADSLFPALETLAKVLTQKTEAFGSIVKTGRTHLQDAAPLTLGQEFSAYMYQIQQNTARFRSVFEELLQLPLGGTAVGTGLNAHPGFASAAVSHLTHLTGLPFVPARNKFALMAGHDSLLQLSGCLNTLAASLTKIANDVRWMGSGPRCGIGELILPENEPGSSIMPGKINPTQCEALLMICAQAMGSHVTVSVAGAGGNFELNVYKPVIIYNVLASMKILAEGIGSFTEYCLKDIAPNREMLAKYLGDNLMLATALNDVVGYDKAALVSGTALSEGLSLKEAVLKLKLLTESEFDRLVDPRRMTGP